MSLLFRTLLLASTLAASAAGAQVRVAATTPALASIAKEVAGAQAQVESLAPPNQDPHFIDARPSLMLVLNRADLLLHVGLDLEAGWLPSLLTGARNPKIQPGQPGNLDVSTFAGQLLETGAKLDRALGDVHAGGNPHYWYDPRRVPGIAAGIAERLGRIDPAHAAAYRANAQRFSDRLRQKIAAWEETMRPHRGRALVTYHRSLVYLQAWLGLQDFATIEPVPGISPSPSHLASLILRIREEARPALVVVEPWYNQRTARTVAEKSGAGLLRLPGDVGSQKNNGDYIAFMDDLVNQLAGALGKP